MHHPTQPKKEHTTRHWVPALALAVCLLLTTGCHTASLGPSDVVADSINGFSDKQGANGWAYGYWDRSADTNKSYSQTADFRLLGHFGSDFNHHDFTTGKRWTLQKDRSFNRVRSRPLTFK
jgi:hypothetical protein